ncbi:MAG: type II secretion system protein GspL [Myxococcaceae bacterium]
MARIAGLDLGSHTIKALVLEASGRTLTSVAVAEVERQGSDTAGLNAALEQLRAQLPGHLEHVVVSLPGSALAVHALTLPFLDAKRLEQTIPFEVEGQLPFDIDEATLDYQVVRQHDGRSDVLVAVVRKPELSALLEALASAGFDPRVVTHPAIAYHVLFAGEPELFSDATGDGAIALIDLGHERCNVAIGRAGSGIAFARTFSPGAKNFAQGVAKAAAAPGADPELAHAALLRGIQPLLRELRPTFKAYAAKARDGLSAIYLCGGAAHTHGLAEALSRELGVLVQPLTLPLSTETVLPTDAQARFAQAYALALRGIQPPAKAGRLNLRRGEFAFSGATDVLKGRLPQLALFASVLLFLGLCFGVANSVILSRREAALDDALCGITQRVLGTCEKQFDRALNMLRGKESPTASLPDTSAVSLLAELTERLPKDVSVRIEQVDIDLDRVQLRAQVDSSKQVDAISRALKNQGCFRDVREGKVEKARGGQGVSFRLDIDVRCASKTAPQTPQG